MASVSEKARSFVSSLSTFFLILAGFLAIFFTVSKSRVLTKTPLPQPEGGIVNADVPYGQSYYQSYYEAGYYGQGSYGCGGGCSGSGCGGCGGGCGGSK